MKLYGPSLPESQKRFALASKIEMALNESRSLAGLKLGVQGSVAQGIYLKNSDMDLVIKHSDPDLKSKTKILRFIKLQLETQEWASNL